MNRRQQIFVESILRRDNPEDHAFLEAVLKSYVINEGILDRGKKIAGEVAGKVRRKVGEVAGKVADAMKEPEQQPFVPKQITPDYASLFRAIKFEPDCWQRDYERFQLHCDNILYFVRTYGNKEFNQVVCSDSFKDAVRLGEQLDKMRTNPALLEAARQDRFGKCMQQYAGEVRKELLEAVMHDFYESECVTVEVPLMESKEDNLAGFRNSMAAIENFIRKHGVYPWNKFLDDNKAIFSLAAMGNRDEYGKAPAKSLPTPSMAAEIMKAYQSGSSED